MNSIKKKLSYYYPQKLPPEQDQYTYQCSGIGFTYSLLHYKSVKAAIANSVESLGMNKTQIIS